MISLISGILLFVYLAVMKIGCESLFRRMKQLNFSYELCLIPCYMLVFITSCFIYIFSFEFPGKVFITFTMCVSLVIVVLLMCLRLLKIINSEWYYRILSKVKK